MLALNHKNIVKCLGIANDTKPYYIALEFIKGCSLRDYLLKNNSNDKLNIETKLKFCEDCAEGFI